jgi:hypothetical protein
MSGSLDDTGAINRTQWMQTVAGTYSKNQECEYNASSLRKCYPNAFIYKIFQPKMYNTPLTSLSR